MPVVPLFPKSSKSEVIIRKNAEQDPEFTVSHRREYMRSYLATFGWQKSGWVELKHDRTAPGIDLHGGKHECGPVSGLVWFLKS